MTQPAHPGAIPDADTARIADRLAIAGLNDAFGACLDHGDVAGFVALFTEDVAYANGPRRLSGQQELRAFFEGRAAAGRVSRHFYSGLRIAFDGADRATGRSLWLTFAGEGSLPLPSTEPFLVADVEDDYRCEQGIWRIARREIAPVFRNAHIPAPTAGTAKR